MNRKYRFATRTAAEDEAVRLERDLTMHRIAMDALLREEFAWTRVYKAGNGAWFQMGVARMGGASGGIVIVREYYPSNLKPGQHCHWAERWISEWQHTYSGSYTPCDDEGLVYRACFYAVRDIAYELQYGTATIRKEVAEAFGITANECTVIV